MNEDKFLEASASIGLGLKIVAEFLSNLRIHTSAQFYFNSLSLSLSHTHTLSHQLLANSIINPYPANVENTASS
jgi:hypothetical protein